MESNIHKLRARVKSGEFHVHCPKCATLQPVSRDPDVGGGGPYEIDSQGKVLPDFVCMKEDRSCRFSGPIWIVNA